MEIPAFLVQLKAIGVRDLYHIQGFMQLLMKPRNGMPWTTEDKQELRNHLRSVGETLPLLVVFTLPGGMLLLPLLAWFLDRRKRPLVLSVVPYPEKPPTHRNTDEPANSSGQE